jgi:hypothetical protein
MAKIQIKNSFITSSADITISSSMVKFSSGISAKNITGSFSGSIPALTSYYKQGGNSFGTTAILGTNDNQALSLETNGSEKVRIDTNGNVGIGTTSPATTLNVSGSTRISAGELQIEGNNAALRLYRTSGINYFDWASGQNLYLGTVTSVGGAGRTNKMVILDSGNVGIGTNAPTQRLDLSGSLRIRSSGTYSDPTDNAGFINYDSQGGLFTISARSNGGSTYMAFRTSNSGTGGERMRIINDGNVGIGTSSPGYKLDVYTSDQTIARFAGTNSSQIVRFGNTAAAQFTDLIMSVDNGQGEIFRNGSANSSYGGASSLNIWNSNGPIAFHPNNTTNAMFLSSAGNLGIGTTSPTALLTMFKTSFDSDADGFKFGYSSDYHHSFSSTFNSTTALNNLGININTGFNTGRTRVMTLLGNGNVGIGTSSPGTKLTIVDASPTVRLQDTNTSVAGGVYGTIDWLSSDSSMPGGLAAKIDVLDDGGSFGDRGAIRFFTNNATSLGERVRISSNGNVGIGTTNPFSKLDVRGNLYVNYGSNGTGYIQTNGSDSDLQITIATNLTTLMNTGGSGAMAFGAGNSERMRILSGGNVGIGTTSPISLLDVRSGYITAGSSASTNGSTILAGYYSNSAGVLTVLGTEQSSGGPVLGYAVTPSTSTTGAFLSSTTITIPRSAYTQDGGTHRWYTGASQTVAIGSAVTTSEKMRLDTNGNLGIGTSSPATLLHVDTAGADARIRVSAGTNTVQGGMIANTGTSLVYAGSITNHGFSLRTNDTDRVRIDTNGNVGIGTTTAATKFVVAADATDSDVGQLRVIGSTSNAKMTNVGYHTTNNYGFIQALIAGTGYSPLSIQPNGGNVGIGTTSPATKLDLKGNLFVANAANGNNTIAFGNIGTLGPLNGSPNNLTGSAFLVVSSSTASGAPSHMKFFTTTGGTCGERMRIAADGNVGIGTSTLFAKLVVSNGSGENIEFTPGNATVNGGLIESINRSSVTTRPDLNLLTSGTSNGSIKFYTNGVNERMRITAVGNVGIGTTSVNAGLEVVNSSRMRGILRPANAPTGSFFNESFTLANDGGAAQGYIYSSIPQTGASFPFDAFGEVLIQGNPRSGYNNGISIITGTGTSQTVKFRVQNDGNVGIGTSSPLVPLHVVGQTYINNYAANTAKNILTLNMNGANYAHIYDTGLAGNVLGLGGTTSVTSVPTTPIMSWDLDDSRVGIGTTSPNAKLQVVGNVRATSFTGSFSGSVVGSNMFVQGGNSFGTTAILGTSDNQALILETNNSEKLRITTAGNVGIGTSSPTAKLDIVGTNTTIALSFGTTVPNNPLFINTYGGAQGIGMDSSDAGIRLVGDYAGGGNRLVDIGYYSSGTIAHANWVSRLRVLNNGNVGIGTTSPICKLNVTSSASTLAASFQGNVGVGNLAGYYYGLCSLTKQTSGLNLNIMYASLSSGYGEILMSNYNDNTGASGWASYIRSYSNPGSDYSSILTFGTSPASLGGPSERMRITAAGYVGIGTSNTTPYSSLFPGQLVIDSGTSNVDGIFVSTNNSNAAELVLTKKNTTNSFGSLLIQHAGTSGDAIVVNYSVNTTTGVSGTNSFKVTTGGDGYFKGNVGIGTTSFVYAAANRGLLEIYGSTDSLISLRNSNNPFYIQKYLTDVYINNTDNGAVILNTNNIERARITSGGNVGIGTTVPTSQLQLSGSLQIGNGTNFGNKLTIYDNFTDGKIAIALRQSTGASVGDDIFSLYCNSTTGEARLLADDDNGVGFMTFYMNASERMRITNNGNIGIGTATPAYLLDVYSGNQDVARFYNNQTTFGLILGSTANTSFTNLLWTTSTGNAQFFKNRSSTSWGGADSFNFYTSNGGFAWHPAGVTNAMYLTTSGNLGIGTSSPATILQVVGTGLGSVGTINIRGAQAHLGFTTAGGTFKGWTGYFNSVVHGSDLDLNIKTGYAGASNIRIGATGDTTQVFISGSGNLGIGTTSPASLLQVGGSSGATATPTAITFDNTYRNGVGGNTSLKIYLYRSGGETYGFGLNNAAGIEYHAGSSGGSSANHAFYTETTEKVRINSAGNLGIGTTSPNCPLQVFSTAATLARFTRDLATDAGFTIGADNNGTVLSTDGVHVIQIYTNSSEKVRLDSNGNVGVGTSSPVFKLDVNGTSGFRDTMAFGPSIGLISWGSMGGGTGFGIRGESGRALSLGSNGSWDYLVINTSGNVGIGTTSPISKLNTYASGSNLSVFKVDGGNGTLFEVTDQLSGSLFSVNDVSGLPLLEVFSNNRIVAGKYGSNALVISGSSVGIGTTTPAYKLQVNGSFGATTKSFVIDHPTKEGKKLVYGSLESPYHGIRLTGRNMLIDGECKVQLPDYIYKLARPESVNIQITPIKCGKVIYVDEISVENNYFVVKYDKSLLESYKNYEFFWDFTATRSDVDELTVEQ